MRSKTRPSKLEIIKKRREVLKGTLPYSPLLERIQDELPELIDPDTDYQIKMELKE